MQKLKSIKSFENEILASEKMINILGGSGKPVGGISTRYVTSNTMDKLTNCSDQNGRINTDQNGGAWLRGQESQICQETPSTEPCW